MKLIMPLTGIMKAWYYSDIPNVCIEDGCGLIGGALFTSSLSTCHLQLLHLPLQHLGLFSLQLADQILFFCNLILEVSVF